MKVTVVKSSNYTSLDNSIFFNKNVSNKAKGLLCTMLSCPPEWNFTVEGLVQMSTDGKDSVRSTLKELEQNGYLVRTQKRNEKGVFTDVEYVIYEIPPQNQPMLDFPPTDNPTQLNNNIINNTLRRNNFVITPRVGINTHSQARCVVVEDVKAILDSAELDESDKQNVLFVFECYMNHYEQKMHREHPPINRSQLTKIINDILTGDITNDEYEWIIEMHFENNYTKQINYNMIHFMTGKTRELLLRRTL